MKLRIILLLAVAIHAHAQMLLNPYLFGGAAPSSAITIWTQHGAVDNASNTGAISWTVAGSINM